MRYFLGPMLTLLLFANAATSQDCEPYHNIAAIADQLDSAEAKFTGFWVYQYSVNNDSCYSKTNYRSNPTSIRFVSKKKLPRHLKDPSLAQWFYLPMRAIVSNDGEEYVRFPIAKKQGKRGWNIVLHKSYSREHPMETSYFYGDTWVIQKQWGKQLDQHRKEFSITHVYQKQP